MLGSILLLAGCNGNEEGKKEAEQKTEQPAENNTEDMKIYNDVHSKYDAKMNEEINKALVLWNDSKEKGGKTLADPQYKEDVKQVTTSTLADIEHIRNEIRVPESKAKEHELYKGYLDETEQAMKKLETLAEEGNSALIREVEVHFATASTYYKRFLEEANK